MYIKINCQYNKKGAWCTNTKVKRSLLGFGARVCSEYNNIKCEHIVKPERQPIVFKGNISKKV